MGTNHPIGAESFEVAWYLPAIIHVVSKWNYRRIIERGMAVQKEVRQKARENKRVVLKDTTVEKQGTPSHTNKPCSVDLKLTLCSPVGRLSH